MRIYLLLTVCAILASCAPKKKPVLTEKDYSDFVTRFDSLVNTGSALAFIDNLDVDGLTDTALNRMEIRGLKRASFGKGFRQGFGEGLKGLGQQIKSYTENGGGYKLLRMYTKNNEPHALFRLNTTEGINYHDLHLVEVNGKVMIGDIYIYLTGENLSATLGRLMEMSLKEGDKSEISDDFITQMQKAREFMQAQQYEEAIHVIDALPEKRRKDKACQLLRIQSAMQLDNEAYTSAIASYERLFPNDASLNLILIDGYILKGNYGEAMDYVDRLDTDVHDPYLDVIRANLYYRMNDLEASEKSFRKAIATVKDLNITSYMNVAQLCIMQDKNAEALEMIKVISKKFRMPPFEAVQKTTTNEEFRKRKEVQEWINNAN